MTNKSTTICFMGTPDFAATCLKKLIDNKYNVVMCICQPDKPVGRKHIITPPPAKVVALEAGIEVFQPDSMKSDESFERISNLNPDLIVTAAYGKILPKRILDIPSLGSINVHASLLPTYRGAAPVQYCILNGEKETGVTIQKMDVGVDTGDILAQTIVPIDINIHTVELMNELAIKGSDLLIDMIEPYIDGKITPIKQDESKATVCPQIQPEQGLFTWQDSAFNIHNKIRAFSEWPGASTLFEGNKMKIYDSLIVDSFDEGSLEFKATAGDVVYSHKGDLVVKCETGYLKLLTLQAAGGKRLNASDCAHNYKPGMRFGE